MKLRIQRFNNFLEQIKEEQKDIDEDLFIKHFSHPKPDTMAQVLHYLKNKANN